MSMAPVSSRILPTDWASSFKVFIFNVSGVFFKEVTKIGFKEESGFSYYT